MRREGLVATMGRVDLAGCLLERCPPCARWSSGIRWLSRPYAWLPEVRAVGMELT